MSKIKIFALGGLNEEGKNMYVVKVDSDIFIFDFLVIYSSSNSLIRSAKKTLFCGLEVKS